MPLHCMSFKALDFGPEIGGSDRNTTNNSDPGVSEIIPIS